METLKSTLESAGISRQTVVSFVRELFDGYPNPDGDPLPRPLDPTIRKALERMVVHYPPPKPPRPNWLQQFYSVMGPLTDPWLPAASSSAHAWNYTHGFTALNPQPLPPIFLFALALADQIITDAVSSQEFIDLIGIEARGRSSERLDRVVEDWCATGRKLKWPFPPPQPPWWNNELSGIQFIVMGVQFEKAAATAFNDGLQKSFANASAKFIKTGLAKME